MMMKYGMRFMQATERLAEIAGVSLPKKHTDSKFDVLKSILYEIVKFFESNLVNYKNAQIYCESRGISQEMIKKFSIGFAPLDGKLLAKHLKISGFSEEEIFKAAIFSKRNDVLVCNFRNRLIFPIFNDFGHPIAFAGRSLHINVVPKYLNSPETPLFKKGEILYAYDTAIKGMSEGKVLVIVEGYMDTVMMHEHGFTSTVASMGTALTEHHLSNIWRRYDEPVVCMDGDRAGRAAMERIALFTLRYLRPGKSLRFCSLPENEDPDSFLRDYGREQMQNAIEKTATLIDFVWTCFLDRFSKINPRTPEGIAQWKKEVFAAVDVIHDSDIRSLYRKEINLRIASIFKTKHSQDSKFLKKPLDMDFGIDKNAKMLLREAILLYMIIVCRSVISYVAEELAAAEFSNRKCQRLRECMIRTFSDGDMSVDECREEVEFVCAVAMRYCDLTGMEDSVVVDLWRSVYKFGFLRKLQKDDVQLAKKECSEELSEQTWTRLKALKIEQVNHNKKFL
jgi:DNA primase